MDRTEFERAVRKLAEARKRAETYGDILKRLEDAFYATADVKLATTDARLAETYARTADEELRLLALETAIMKYEEVVTWGEGKNIILAGVTDERNRFKAKLDGLDGMINLLVEQREEARHWARKFYKHYKQVKAPEEQNYEVYKKYINKLKGDNNEQKQSNIYSLRS